MIHSLVFFIEDPKFHQQVKHTWIFADNVRDTNAVGSFYSRAVVCYYGHTRAVCAYDSTFRTLAHQL